MRRIAMMVMILILLFVSGCSTANPVLTYSVVHGPLDGHVELESGKSTSGGAVWFDLESGTSNSRVESLTVFYIGSGSDFIQLNPDAGIIDADGSVVFVWFAFEFDFANCQETGMPFNIVEFVHYRESVSAIGVPTEGTFYVFEGDTLREVVQYTNSGCTDFQNKVSIYHN